jgi:hypothetical protein
MHGETITLYIIWAMNLSPRLSWIPTLFDIVFLVETREDEES